MQVRRERLGRLSALVLAAAVCLQAGHAFTSDGGDAPDGKDRTSSKREPTERKRKTRGEASNVNPIDVERVLLQPPAAISDKEVWNEWFQLWHRNVEVGYREWHSENLVQDLFPERCELVGIGVRNSSPCVIRIKQDGLSGMKLFERGKPKDAPSDSDFEVEPGEKIVLTKNPGIKLRPIRNEASNGKSVGQIVTYNAFRIEVLPKHTDLKPVELQVVIRLGHAGHRAVFVQYFPFPVDSADEVRKALGL